MHMRNEIRKKSNNLHEDSLDMYQDDLGGNAGGATWDGNFPINDDLILKSELTADENNVPLIPHRPYSPRQSEPSPIQRPSPLSSPTRPPRIRCREGCR